MQPSVIRRELPRLAGNRLLCRPREPPGIIKHDPVNHLTLGLACLGDLFNVRRILRWLIGLLAQCADIAAIEHHADLGGHNDEGPEGETPWARIVLAYERSG